MAPVSNLLTLAGFIIAERALLLPECWSGAGA